MNIKYLKYAIGEIVLVVIGILIALAINNWNELRKDHIIEDQILDEMLISLKSDNEIFLMLEGRLMEKDSAIQLLMDYKEKGSTPDGSTFRNLIGIARQGISFTYDTSPYQSLVSLGINKMSDKPLLNEINNYYTQILPRNVKFLEDLEAKFEPILQSSEEEAVRKKLLKRHFIKDSTGRWQVQYDSSPNRLFDDDSFYQSLVVEYMYMNESLFRLRYLIKENKGLIELLENQNAQLP